MSVFCDTLCGNKIGGQWPSKVFYVTFYVILYDICDTEAYMSFRKSTLHHHHLFFDDPLLLPSIPKGLFRLDLCS